MKTFNPKMLELARNARELTQKDLAAVINISQPNLSKIEKGEIGVSDMTLDLISNALSFPTGFFFQEELRTPFSNIYFRKRATVRQKMLDKIFADIKIVLKSIDSLLEEIELKEYPRYSFDLSEGWTPEDVAIRAREVFCIPSGPIKTPIKFLEEKGVIVYFYDTNEEKFDGVTTYSDNGVPVIFVNKRMPNDRLRFTIAHELGHLLMHIPCDIEPWRDVEQEANQFASEFCMPARECYRDLQSLSYNDLGRIKSFWGVSKAAIIRRAKTLSSITEPTYKYLMIELGRRNERKKESVFVDIDAPLILKTVIDLLKGELHYTSETISQKLLLPLDQYLGLFDDSNSQTVKIKPLRMII
jgi:Zn-dependent peptidase ImmA (M78 family)/transcriptional regulator with XRE-family HTH domain